MKKITALLLVIAIIAVTLISCGKKQADADAKHSDEASAKAELPKGINGIDASKLILANERLNSQLFKNTDSLFDSGATAFATLYNIADQNMIKYADTLPENKLLTAKLVEASAIQSLSASSAPELTLLANDTQTLSNGSVLEINGNVYRWSNFGEYSNSYDYFLNLTTNVKSSAEVGARLIDDTKKFVRIVDTWVNVGGTQYYLHVEDDMEIIYCRADVLDEVCRRYKRADGVNVYDVYRRYHDGGSSRMVYIPGEKYEYSYIVNNFNHNFMAENTKGFWEVVDVGQTDWGYNVSCMVLKDDICYDSFYDASNGTVGMLKVISPDKKTDIMNINIYEDSSSISLNLQAFRGVDYVELITDNVVPLGEESTYDKYVLRYDVPESPKQKSRTVYFAGTRNCTLVLKNGLTISPDGENEFLDGKVKVEAISADHVSMEGDLDGYVSEMSLQVMGKTYDEVMNNLEAFLAVCGLECTRDFNMTKSGITQAYTELEQMTKYHTWNESPIRSVETLDAGYRNNLNKHKAFSDMLDAIKDAEVIDFNDKEAVELKINFAPIVSQTAVSVKNNGLSVSVSDLALSVDDTTLFVVGEKYKVNFAIVGTADTSSAGLVHIELGQTPSVAYADADTFKVNQTATFDIPVVSVGEYTVVAYISTEDGIRSSAYQPLAFTEVTRYEAKQDGVNIVADKKENGQLVISISQISDVEVSVALPEGAAHSYADMFTALEEKAYLYGFVDEGSVLETSADGKTWTALTGNEATLESGSYRLKYSIKNGSSVSEGYVYTAYTKAA